MAVDPDELDLGDTIVFAHITKRLDLVLREGVICGSAFDADGWTAVPVYYEWKAKVMFVALEDVVGLALDESECA